MRRYGVREIEKLLGLPRSTIRTLVAAGFVTPTRGPRNALIFSFQDLIVLRTARALTTAKLPPRRITRALRALRRRLPASMPLSGLRIAAVDDRVVVQEGSGHWHADSGQYLLAFDGDPERGALAVIERPPVVEDDNDAARCFERAAELERRDPEKALAAYGQALALEPAFLDAHLNRGRLLHELGRNAEAELGYRRALRACGREPLLLFNLAVLLEDMDDGDRAAQAYEEALSADPRLADCHYNLALLYDRLGKPQQAIRHMSQYRRLTARRPE